MKINKSRIAQFKAGVRLAWNAIIGKEHRVPPLSSFDGWWVNENCAAYASLRECYEQLRQLDAKCNLKLDEVKQLYAIMRTINAEAARMLERSSPLMKPRPTKKEG